MNRAEENASTVTVIAAESPQEIHEEPTRNGKTPFVPQKQEPKPSLRDNGRVLFIGAGLVLVLLLFAFSGVSRQPSSAQGRFARPPQARNALSPEDTNPSISLTPILDAGVPPQQNSDDSLVHPDQIGPAKGKTRSEPVVRSLGDVPAFGKPQMWRPVPFQEASEPTTTPDSQVGYASDTQSKNNLEAGNDTSLVFVRNNKPPLAIEKSQEAISRIDLGVDLAPGTKLRARLQSAISTAINTPVVAIIQYNYEKDGEILIPAGAQVFGQIESADNSGYLGIRFESLQMPSGSSFALNATATDLQLRPVRGKVEGKHAGRSIVIRSFAGVGEIAASLLGRGSLNQPLSEEDLLRERLTNNIGQASDQSLVGLAVTGHVVVSMPAGTEIYVVLQKSAVKDVTQGSRNPAAVTTSTQLSIDELRQLLQLQRELNLSLPAKPLD